MIDHSDDRIDFSPLDPLGDPAREERVVSAVMARISVSPRTHAEGVWQSIAAFMRPALAAAAVIVVASGSALVYAQRAESAPTSVADVTESVGLSPPIAAWVAGGVAPSAGDLVVLARGYR